MFKQNAFLTCSWRFLISNKLEQLAFKLQKIIGIKKYAGKVRKWTFSLKFLCFQLKICFWFLATITSIQMMAALTFKPLMPPIVDSGPKKDCINQIINVDNWKNKKYVIWALAIPVSLFGYFVPFVHIVSYERSVNLKTNSWGHRFSQNTNKGFLP